jgi:hypothetical protein
MGDRIIGVQFGIANPDEIVSRSVVEVITDNTYRAGQPVPGGVFDSRFGVIENGKVCPTCKQTNLLCPGHFGHIKLARPVYLYQFLDPIQKILQIVCLNCSNPYLPDEELDKISARHDGIDRFNQFAKRPRRSRPRNSRPSRLVCTVELPPSRRLRSWRESLLRFRQLRMMMTPNRFRFSQRWFYACSSAFQMTM